MGARSEQRIVRQWIIPVLLVVCLSGWASAQPTAIQRKAKSTSETAEITRFFIEESKKGSPYETGPLHIAYDDGTEIIKTLPPMKKSTEKETVFNDVGFSYVQLAADRQTLGWAVDVENCCTSYPIPQRVVIFRRGKVLHAFAPGLVWNWMFFLGGKRVAIVSGPSHGPEVGDYRLYDVRTGTLISKVMGDEDPQSLKPDAPKWAQLLQERLHKH
jgi:hypothetical protein